MSKIQLSYCLEADVHEIQAGALTPADRFSIISGMKSPAAVAYSLKDESGKVLAILGGYFMYSKVMEVWTYVDKSVETCGFSYARFMPWIISQMFIEHGLNRMQFTVRAKQPWSERWIRFLGFKIETCMANYGEENEPYYLASRTEA